MDLIDEQNGIPLSIKPILITTQKKRSYWSNLRVPRAHQASLRGNHHTPRVPMGTAFVTPVFHPFFSPLKWT